MDSPAQLERKEPACLIGACWDLLDTRAPAGRRRVDSGTRIQRGSRRGVGTMGEEGEVSVNHINERQKGCQATFISFLS